MGIRKQVYDLTLEDFENYPVWEFCMDEEDVEGQDETTVRPSEEPLPLEVGREMSVVLAEFILADGTQMKGYLYAPMSALRDDIGMGFQQPNIFTLSGHVGFWHGIMKPSADAVSKSYSMLGKKPSDVFPVHYSSSDNFLQTPVEGEIKGFYYIQRGLFGRESTKLLI